MNIIDARWLDAEHTTIQATIDGLPVSIPAVTGNRHYDAIIDSGVQVAEFIQPLP